MATTLANCMIEMSRQMGDLWSSSATSSGAAGGTTIVDTALSAKATDWIHTEREMYTRITSGTYVGNERYCQSLSGSTLTTLAHGGQILSAVTYEIHRLFSASAIEPSKRSALIYAARKAYPHIFKEIRDETRTWGNWLYGGSGDFETWTVSTVPDTWTRTSVTAAQNTNMLYVTRGTSSCKLSTAAGNILQGISNNANLSSLVGKYVTFKGDAWCDTASCARLRIYDGVNTYNSDYHSGDDGFEELTVSGTVSENASEVSFMILHDVAAGVTYADNMRVVGPNIDRVYIGDLTLARNRPHGVYMTAESSNINSNEPAWYEPWQQIQGDIGSDGYFYSHHGATDYRLRIIGMGYLDFLLAGVSSTDWAATIALNSPQTDILIAEAIVYLYQTKIMPTGSAGDTKLYAQALSFWKDELTERKRKFAMVAPAKSIDYGI